MKRALVLAATLAACVLAPLAAASATLPELPTLASDDANARPVAAGVTYAASSFPIAVRITPPDRTWLAGQGGTVTAKRGSYGWAEFMHGPPGVPRGAISMITSADPTRSVAATVAQLRSEAGVTFGPVSAVRLAGFRGSRFDAEVGAKSRRFVPFSPPSHAAVFHPDAYLFDAGEVLRIVALDVRGKTVVLLLENAGLPAAQFPTFLDSANGLLGTLRFPA
jgi:hypothetical protein